MTVLATEALHEHSVGLDQKPYADIVLALLESQQAALAVVSQVIQEVSQASALMAETIRQQGRLVYLAAGSSGMMAVADALELGSTFGIAKEHITILLAGGMPKDTQMLGHIEDGITGAKHAAQTLNQHDTVIAVSASGSTPYVLAVLEAAHDRGTKIISIANNAHAPIFAHADISIHLNTPAEIIAGSTRLGAGTAQKAVLNMMSTLMGIRLGHVHDGMMINVTADNEKLRERAARIVAHIADVTIEDAQVHLEATAGQIKPAILLAAGASTLTQAQELNEQTQGHLRDALSRI